MALNNELLNDCCIHKYLKNLTCLLLILFFFFLEFVTDVLYAFIIFVCAFYSLKGKIKCLLKCIFGKWSSMKIIVMNLMCTYALYICLMPQSFEWTCNRVESAIFLCFFIPSYIKTKLFGMWSHSVTDTCPTQENNFCCCYIL